MSDGSYIGLSREKGRMPEDPGFFKHTPFDQPKPFVDERSGNDGKGFYIRTFTGKQLYWEHVEDHDFDVVDIAHALSMKCRWSGHTRKFYSVAQHSVMVSQLVPDEHKMDALFHDLSEAYMPDFPSPLKWYLRDKGFTVLSDMEKRLEAAAAKKLGLKFPRDPSIKEADLILLSTESRDLMPPGEERVGMIWPLEKEIDCWSPMMAKALFLKEYRKLRGVVEE